MGWALDVGYASALTIAAPWLAWRALRTGRYREGWNERLWGAVPPPPRPDPCIWVHGVSLGEVQLLRPLVHRLLSSYPQYQPVLSTSTLTGMQVARSSLAEVPAFYCPWDFSWAMRNALRRLKPKLIVLGELELWPNWLACAHQQQIPVAIVNGRLSDRSFQGYRKFQRLFSRAFSQLAIVAAQDEATAQRFHCLGVPSERISVTGSLKFDNVNRDRQHVEVQRLRQLARLTTTDQVWLAGSTQAPEEQAALDTFAQLQAKHPQLKLILVPRHPERFEEVHQLVKASGLRGCRRSQLVDQPAPADWQVLLVDSVGELKWWWGLADLALVGGSFGNRGGQNMLEPAAYGSRVAFGPNTWNFRHIVQSLLEQNAAWQLADLAELPQWVDDQLTRPEEGQARSQRAVQWIESHQGALDRTLALLEPRLVDSDTRWPTRVAPCAIEDHSPLIQSQPS